MKRISFWLTTAAFSLMVLGMPAVASAQWGGNQNGGNNNGGYYGNGQYGNNGYGMDTRQTVKELKKRTKDFQRALEREVKNNRNRNYGRDDQMDRMAKDFKRSVDRLNDRFDQRRSNDVRQVIDMASQLDRMMGRNRFGYEVGNNWSAVRHNLDNLAQAYGIYNRNQRNDRNGRGGGWGNGNGNGNTRGGNMPNWWPF